MEEGFKSRVVTGLVLILVLVTSAPIASLAGDSVSHEQPPPASFNPGQLPPPARPVAPFGGSDLAVPLPPNGRGVASETLPLAGNGILVSDGEGTLENPLPFDLVEVVEQSRNSVQVSSEGQPFVEGPGHRAFFDEGKLRFVPRFERGPLPAEGLFVTQTLDPNFPLTLTVELAGVHVGGQALFQGPALAAAHLDGNVVRFERAPGLVEEYVARDAGVEQRWWIEEDPVLEGDLVVAVEITTALALEMADGGDGFVFRAGGKGAERGMAIARYGQAWALDAAGRSYRAILRAEEVATDREGAAPADRPEVSLGQSGDQALRRYRLEMRVPADWLAQARYPLLIDPLIGSLLRLDAALDDGDQTRPEVAYNPADDEYLVVWQDNRNGGDNTDIYAQRVSGEGILVGENIVVSGDPFRQILPCVSYATTGDVYLVAWRHHWDAGDDEFDVRGQLLSPAGELLGDPIAITGLVGRERPTDIVYNSNSDQFLVLWNRYTLGTPYNVWGRHVSTAGALSPEIQIVFGADDLEHSAQAAYDPDDDQYLVVWESHPTKDDPRDIWARRVAGDGYKVSQAVPVATGPAHQWHADVVYQASAGRFVVVWEDDRNGDYDVFGQLVSHGGTLVGANYGVAATALLNDRRPRIALDGFGGALVVWDRTNGGQAGQDLYARRLDVGGNPVGDAFAVFEGYGGQRGPGLVGNGAGFFLVAWEDSRGDDWDVYARRVGPEGPLGADFIVHPVPGDQIQPRVTYNPDDDEYLVVWADFRAGVDDSDIYAQRVSAEGALVGDNLIINSEPYRQLMPKVAYAPGEGVYLAAWRHETGPSDLHYDAYGQLISSTGDLVGGTIPIANLSGHKRYREAPTEVVYNGTTKEFMVLWIDLQTHAWNVWGRFVSTTGVMGPKIQITSLYRHETNAQAAYNLAADQFLVVWEYRPTLGDNSNYDVRGRRMTGSGTVTSTDAIDIATGLELQRFADVVYLGQAGQYAVVWQDEGAGNWDIHGQLIFPDGTLGDAYVVAEEPQDETRPRLAVDGKGGALVVWERDNGGSAGYDLYGRRLGIDGQPEGDAFVILSADGDQQYPDLVSNGDGTFLLAWQDNRNGNWDIYASLFQPLRADFSAGPTSGEVALRVLFTDESTPAGVADQWHWDFGTGDTSTLQHPVYTYTAAGSYTVTLRVTDTETGEWDELSRPAYISVTAGSLDPTPGDQRRPRVAYNPDDDEYLVVWQDNRTPSSGWDVYARRVSSEGVPLGESFAVISATYEQSWAHVAYAPGEGVYLVAWRHCYDAGDYSQDVYGQMISRTGELVGGPIIIGDDHSTWGGEVPTDIVFNSTSQQFLVLWKNLNTGWWDTWARHVSMSGTMGPKIRVTFTSSDHEAEAVGAYDPDSDRYLIAWNFRVAPSSSGPHDVQGRMMTGDGSLVGSTIYIATGTPDQRWVDVVFLAPIDRYALVWQDDREGDYGVYGQLVSPDGALDGGNYVISQEVQDETWPRLALDGQGGALVVWERDNGGSAGYDLYGRRLGADAQPVGAAFAIVEWDRDQGRPDVAGDGGGRFLVAWEDNRGVDWDIYTSLLQPLWARFSAAPTSGGAALRVQFTDESTPAGVAAQWHWDFGTGGTSALQHPGYTYTAAGSYTVTLRVTDTETGEWDELSRPAYISVTAGGPIHPVPGDQRRPNVAYNPDDDEYLVVWQDYRNGADNADIYAQRLSGGGELLGGNIVVQDTLYGQIVPHVAYAPGKGVYLVVWRHHTAPPNFFDAYGQIISRTGELVGDPIPIADRGGPWDREYPWGLVYNGSSQQFLVLWSDLHTGYWNVWARHVSTTGTMGPKIQVTFLDHQHESARTVAYNPDDDQYLIVWEHRDSPDDPRHVRARRMSGDGLLVGGILDVAAGTADQRFPDVVYLPLIGRYAVVWQDERGGDYGIYGQLVSPDGTLDGGNYVISQEAQDEKWPRLALDGSGGALVVWERDNGGVAAYDLYSRRLGGDAQPAGATFAIVEWDSDQRRPGVAGDGQGRYLVAWEDYRGGDWDIYTSLLQLLWARFSAAPTSGGAALRVQFTDESTPAGVADQWHWDFGTGDTSTLQHPVYTYTAAGCYTVTLRVTDTETGEWDELTRPAYVRVTDFGPVIPHPPTGDQYQPDVAYNPDDDEYLVVWVDRPFGSDSPDIHARRMSGDGATLGGNILVTDAPLRQDDVRVAYAPGEGVYLVAWVTSSGPGTTNTTCTAS